MGGKSACIVYVETDGCDPSPLKGKLEAHGYVVTLCPVSLEAAAEVKGGDFSNLPESMRQALEGADLCVVLISECADASEELAEAVSCVVNGGGDILGVWPNGLKAGKLPNVLVDYGCDIVGENDPEIDKVIEGESESWTDSSGKPARSAPVSHQSKC